MTLSIVAFFNINFLNMLPPSMCFSPPWLKMYLAEREILKKMIRAKNMLKTKEHYRNNFGTLKITQNRLGRKFFLVGSVTTKAFLTHAPFISAKVFQSRTSGGP